MKENPVEVGPQGMFKKFLRDVGKLHLQCCDACDLFFFPPRVLCPHCGGSEVKWCRVSGDGTVYASTTVRSSGSGEPDHNVAVIELDEGPRIMSTVQGASSADPLIGSRVSADISREGGNFLLVFSKHLI